MIRYNETPYPVAVFPWVPEPDRPCMVVAVKASFAISHDGRVTALPAAQQIPLSHDRFYSDGKGAGTRYPTDFVPFKPCADVLVNGSCHAPGGVAVPFLEASIAVGRLAKIIGVFGNRFWLTGPDGRPAPTAPKPFTAMPLRTAHAYGGPGDPANPRGIGRQRVRLPDGRWALPMPNLVGAGDYVPEPERPPAPAALGPISRFARRHLAGTRDRSWRQQRWPFPPTDFDWSFFNRAPDDQRLSGYLVGNEAVQLNNIHPDLPAFRTRLPGLRVRVFAHVTSEAEGTVPPVPHLVEVGLNLDTLYIDVPEMRMTLVWRGMLEAPEQHRLHVANWMIVEEPLDGPGNGADGYAARLGERLRRAPKLKTSEHLANRLVATGASEDAVSGVRMAGEAGLQRQALERLLSPGTGS